MFNIGDTVIYGAQGICKIEEKIQKDLKGKMTEYFVLKPIYEKSSTIFLPLENDVLMSRMRPILSKDEVLDIINTIPSKETIWIENENLRKTKYGEILVRSKPIELVQLIKTLFLHEKKQKQIGRKFHLTDEAFLKDAEKILYSEFAYVLNIKTNEVIPFITEQLENC